MGKNILERGRPRMTIWHMFIDAGYLRLCFSTETMVAQMRLNVTLYVQCLCFYYTELDAFFPHPPSFCKIYSNLILPPMPRSSKRSLCFKRWAEIFFPFLPRLSLAYFFPHPYLMWYPCNMWWSVHTVSFSLRSFLPPHITSSLLDPNVLLRTLLLCMINLYCPCVMLFWWHIHCPNDQVLQTPLFWTTL
jgi:hypothetical protein